MLQRESRLSMELTRRPLGSEDINRLRRAAKERAVAARTAALLKLHESELLQRTLSEMKAQNPNQIRNHAMMWEKTHRDMLINIRYALQCAALDDLEWGNQKVWWWLRTIYNAFHFKDSIIENSYRHFQHEVRELFPPEEAACFNKYIDGMLETLAHDREEALEPAVQ